MGHHGSLFSLGCQVTDLRVTSIETFPEIKMHDRNEIKWLVDELLVPHFL